MAKRILEDLSVKTQDIAEAIEHSIKDLVEEYEKSPRSFLTESDVTNRLYSILINNLDMSWISLHSELRPVYFPKEGRCLTIIESEEKSPSWEPQLFANRGSMVDLALVKSDADFFEIAFKKAKEDQGVKDNEKLKYWRMLSYPVESFVAAIEIKIKVFHNQNRINKDIKKLEKIKEKNSRCQLYLVVLDKRAGKNALDKFQEPSERSGVTMFSNAPID